MEKSNIIKNMSRIEVLGRVLAVCKKTAGAMRGCERFFFVVLLFVFVYIDVA